MNVFFATPCYRSDPRLAAHWALTMAEALGFEKLHLSIVAECPHLDLARETLIANYRASEDAPDLFLFRDDDVDLPPETLQKMIDARSPIVSVPYAKRNSPQAMLDVNGLGCVLIQQRVLQALWEHHRALAYDLEGREHVALFDPLYITSPDGKKTKLREDRAFLERARRLGFPKLLLNLPIMHAGVATTPLETRAP